MARSAIGHYNTLNKNRSPGELKVYEEFGRRLQARMVALGWGQSEFARRASAHLPRAAKGQVQGHSIGRDRISSYIRGKYLPRPEALEALAKALKCKPEDLLPAESVPSVVSSGSKFDAKELEGGRVMVHLNREMSRKAFMAILSILEDDDKMKV